MTVSQRGTPTISNGDVTGTAPSTWGTGQIRTAGDLLIAVVGGYDSGGSFAVTTPTGWVLAASQLNAGFSNTYYYTKTAAGSDAAPNFVWGQSGSFSDIEITLYDLLDSSGLTPTILFAGGSTGTTTSPLVATATGTVPAAAFAISAVTLEHSSTSAVPGFTTPTSWSLGASITASQHGQHANFYYAAPPTGGSLASSMAYTRATEHTSGDTVVVGLFPGPFTSTGSLTLKKLTESAAALVPATCTGSLQLKKLTESGTGSNGQVVVQEDASTPATVTARAVSTQSTATTASFSPPAGALLVAVVSVGSAGAASSMAITMTNTGTALPSWVPGPVIQESDNFTRSAILTCQLTTAPGAITISAKVTGCVTDAAVLLALRVANNAAASQTGAASVTQASTSGTLQKAVITTVTGSKVYIAGGLGGSGAFTNVANTTTLGQFNDTVDTNNAYVTGKAASTTGVPGSTTFGWTQASAAWSFAALEILPTVSVSTTSTGSLSLRKLTESATCLGGDTTSTGSLKLKKLTENATSVESLPISALTENFSAGSLDVTKWTGSFGTFSQATGQMVFTTATGAGYEGFNTIMPYNLTGGSLSTQLVTAGNAALQSLETYPTQLYVDSNNKLNWVINNSGGTLYVVAMKTIGGANTVLYSTAYNSATHKFFRISESGGTITWATSADSLSWTTAATLANPFSVTALYLQLTVGTWNTEASGTTVILDNVNLTPITSTGSLSLRKLSEAGAVWFFTSTGGVALRRLTETATATETFASTGSLALKRLGESGTAQSFAFSGSLALRRLTEAGTAAETFSSTGSLALRKLTESGTSAQTLTSTGSLSAKKLSESGTGAEIFTLAGAPSLRKLSESGTAAETLGSTGSLSLRKLQQAGTVAEVFTSTGSLGLKKLSEAGTGFTSFMATGSLALRKMQESGLIIPPGATVVSLALKLPQLSGTVTETFTSTGSLALKKLTTASTVAQTFTSTGSLALKKMYEPAPPAHGFTRFNSAEGGSNTTAVTAANSGGASGYAFDSTAGTFPTYSSTVAQSGSLSFSGTLSTQSVVWNIPSPPSTIWVRSWFYVATAMPSGNAWLQFAGTTATSITFITPAGKLGVDNAASGVTNGSSTYSVNTWYRLETQFTPNQLIANTYDSSGNLIETVTSAVASGNRGTVAYVGFGFGASTTIYQDNLSVSDRGWIGSATSFPLWKQNTAEGGVNGVVVTAANSGGLSSDDPIFPVGVNQVFDNTYAQFGSQSFKFTATAVSGSELGWPIPGTVGTLYTRTYVLFSSLYNCFVMGGPGAGPHNVTMNGTHWTCRAGGGATTTGTTVPAINRWYRLEGQFVFTAGALTAVVQIYDDTNALLETISAAGVSGGLASYFYFGSLGANVGSQWHDNVALSDQGWIGPYLPVNTATQTITCSGSLGLKKLTMANFGPNQLSANDSEFETSIAGWAVQGNTSIAWDASQANLGSHSLRVTSTGAGDFGIAGVYQNASLQNVPQGTVVMNSCWVRTTSPGVQIYAYMYTYANPTGGGAETTVSTYALPSRSFGIWQAVPSDGAWYQFSWYGIIPAGRNSSLFSLKFYFTNGQIVNVDTASVSTAIAGETFSCTGSLSLKKLSESATSVETFTSTGSLSLKKLTLPPFTTGFTRFNSAEGGSNTTTVTAANSGGASGYAFDGVTNAATYSSTVAQSGSNSYAFSYTTALTATIVWLIPTLASNLWQRSWIYLPSSYLPFGNGWMQQVTANVSARSGISSAMKIVSYGGAGSQNVGTYVLSANTWYRLETQYIWATSTVTTNVYDNSGTLLDTVSATSTTTWTNGFTTQSFGAGFVSSSGTGTLYMDNLAVSDQGWIGSTTSFPLAKQNSAEGGMNGAVLTAANSGRLSGDAVDVIAGTQTFDSTHVQSGALAYKFAAVNSFSNWTLPGTLSALYLRAYVYLTAMPGTSTVIPLYLLGDAGVHAVQFGVTSAGNHWYATLSGATTVTGSIVPSLSTWYRMEIQVTFGATTAQVIGNIYAGESTTPLETLTTVANGTFAIPMRTSWGAIGATATTSYWLDSIAVSDQGWIGPVLTLPNLGFETFTSTGSLTLKKLQESGTEAETFTCTGSLGLQKLSGAGTATQTITCTGSLKLKKLQANPSFVKNNNAEGGTNGTTVTAGNSGGASGDAFDIMAGTVTYDNTHVQSGAMAYKPSTASYARWNLPGSLAKVFSRQYFYATAWPTGIDAMVVFADAATHYCALIWVATGHWELTLNTGGGGASVIGTTTPALNTWYRLEMETIFGNGTAQGIARIYDSSSTLLETITTSATGTMVASQCIDYGQYMGYVPSQWQDSFSVSDQDWIGAGLALSPVQVTETFTCSGSLGLKKLSESGTGAETFTSTGSLSLKKLSESGTEAETFTSTGSLSLRRLSESATAAETFTASGSLTAKKLTESATATEVFTSTGSLALKRLGTAGTSAETIGSTGSASLRKLSESGTAAEAIGSTGSLGLRQLSTSGTSSETFPLYGSVTLPKAGLDGTGVAVYTCTGSLVIGRLSASGLEAELFIDTGDLLLRTLSMSGDFHVRLPRQIVVTESLVNPDGATMTLQPTGTTITLTSANPVS